MVEIRFKPGEVGSVPDGYITDAKVNAAAAIAKSKLAALNIVNADVSGSAAIAKSKLAALDIVNADVASDAAIAKTKLGALDIVDADVAIGADISVDKVLNAVAGSGSSGDTVITTLGWDSITEEVVVVHE